MVCVWHMPLGGNVAQYIYFFCSLLIECNFIWWINWYKDKKLDVICYTMKTNMACNRKEFLLSHMHFLLKPKRHPNVTCPHTKFVWRAFHHILPQAFFFCGSGCPGMKRINLIKYQPSELGEIVQTPYPLTHTPNTHSLQSKRNIYIYILCIIYVFYSFPYIIYVVHQKIYALKRCKALNIKPQICTLMIWFKQCVYFECEVKGQTRDALVFQVDVIRKTVFSGMRDVGFSTRVLIDKRLYIYMHSACRGGPKS